MDRIAGVCILDNPYHIDGIYDYAIPTELEDCVRGGVFVTVPFGMANRHRLALVIEVRDRSEYKELKYIHAVCPDNISLDEEMQRLCAFMKQRTLCPTGDAVRAMVPSGALSRLVPMFSLNPDYILHDSDELSSSDLFVYEYLREKGETGEPALRKVFGAGVELRLRRMCARGILSRRVILKDREITPVEKLYVKAELPEGSKCKPIGDGQKAVLAALDTADEPLTQNELLARAGTTASPLRSLVAKGMVAVINRKKERNSYTSTPFVGRTPIALNEEQGKALETLSSLAFSGRAHGALLHGVTGSGKTAVMTVLIDRLLDAGKGVILLLPEIALTPQSVSIFCARYGDKVAVIHSALSAGERYDAYLRIKEGKATVVIGTRSAVFSPVQSLGAIIIDEEQEHTYKSDQNPKYHARDIARFRCAHHEALMLLASATPSLESYYKAREGIYTLVKLTHRYGEAALPQVLLSDMRREIAGGNVSPLGEPLLRHLVKTVGDGEQAILFLNRRGYNHFVSCRSCGAAITCPSCSVAMTYHTRKGNYREGEMVCHWCGRRIPLPEKCPTCSSEHLARLGFGTQRIQEELTSLLPHSTVLRMDTDTTSTKSAYDEMLGDFRAHRADVLLGTQMVTKGHDFPDVTLVGVLLADASLYLDDYRASERTFSMLTQVIGRAGRGKKPGLAVIQTNNPDSEIIKLAAAQDYETFYEREIKLRRLLVFPPFCDIVLLTLTGQVESMLLKGAKLLAEELRKRVEGDFSDVAVVTFGPFEAPVYRVDNKYRMRLVIKCRLGRRTYEMLADLITDFSKKTDRHMTVSADFNPSGL